MPAWVFHGEDDPIVPVDEARRMVDALRAAGADEVRLTIYPGVGHDSWTKAYDSGGELFEWFLKHPRTKP